MATAEERGFSFKDLPTVVDPAVEAIEVKLVPYRDPGAELRDEDVVFATYRRVIFAAEVLPIIQDLDFANIYGDDPDPERASRAFAYGANGVLRAILYRGDAPHRHWLVERMPEEFTGEHVPKPSVRFMFAGLETAREVAELAGRLQVAVATHNRYDAMQPDAQRLINLIVGQGSEPRLVEVADPVQRRQF